MAQDVYINGVLIFNKLYYTAEYHKTISIPTGLVDQGTNTLELTFSAASNTIFEDSQITFFGAPAQ